jgi:hypothetical protein
MMMILMRVMGLAFMFISSKFWFFISIVQFEFNFKVVHCQRFQVSKLCAI